MYKISNSTILYKFLFFILFIAIISKKIGIIAYLGVIFFLLIFFFFKLKNNQINTKIFLFFIIGVLILYCNFIYQIFYYNYSNLYYLQFFGAQLLFFLIFSFFVDVNSFIEKKASTFLVVSLYLLALIVFVDYILIEIGLSSYQLNYSQSTPKAYLGKPLGLFSQFSINSTYGVVFYMLYLGFEKRQSRIKNLVLIFLVTLIIFLQNSGTGYIAYLLLIITMLYKYSLAKYLLIPFIVLTFVFIVQLNIIEKISIDYLIFTFEYFYEIININYVQNVHNIWDFFFGIDGTYNLPIDFGPIFMIGKVGFLYFVFYSMILLYLFYKAFNRYFRMSIFILAFGNLHYPTLFYPIMNLLLPILLIHILNLNKGRF